VTAERWLVAGLGNPESEYGGTRHNVGADVVRVLAARIGAALTRNRRVRGAVAECTVAGSRLVLFVADAYMNRSGSPVAAAARWYKVPVERIVVCHDDLDLPVGALRFKRGGGNAGHNGLADVDRALGTADYVRVRIGIGRPPGRMPPRDFVLARFTEDERAQIEVTLEEAADAIVTIASDGLEAAQNRWHAPGGQTEPRRAP
jgi:peptidyl-tRNA hydrolase, PTH1 family